MRLTEEQELTVKMAKRGYESYAAYTGGKSAVTGDELPTWDELPGAVCNAWFASAEGMTSFLASVGPTVVVDKDNGDYRSRLITENRELRERLGKLRSFINGKDYRKIPTGEKLLLAKQEKAMTDYHSITETRLAI